MHIEDNLAGYSADRREQFFKIGRWLLDHNIVTAERLQELFAMRMTQQDEEMCRDNPEHYAAVAFSHFFNDDECIAVKEYKPSPLNLFEYLCYLNSTRTWMGVRIEIYRQKFGVLPNSDLLDRWTESQNDKHGPFYVLARKALDQRVDYRAWEPELRARLKEFNEQEALKAKTLSDLVPALVPA